MHNTDDFGRHYLILGIILLVIAPFLAYASTILQLIAAWFGYRAYRQDHLVGGARVMWGALTEFLILTFIYAIQFTLVHYHYMPHIITL